MSHPWLRPSLTHGLALLPGHAGHAWPHAAPRRPCTPRAPQTTHDVGGGHGPCASQAQEKIDKLRGRRRARVFPGWSSSSSAAAPGCLLVRHRPGAGSVQASAQPAWTGEAAAAAALTLVMPFTGAPGTPGIFTSLQAGGDAIGDVWRGAAGSTTYMAGPALAAGSPGTEEPLLPCCPCGAPGAGAGAAAAPT